MEPVLVNGAFAHANESADTYKFLRVDADMLRNVWPTFIRPGVVAIKEKNPTLGFWQPEHVRAHLEAGLAGRMFCECNLIVREKRPTDPLAFVVLKLYYDEFLQVPTTLFVWLTWSRETVDMAQVTRLVELRGRELGMRWVEGVTARGSAYARRLEKLGYRIHTVTIRKAIS